MTGATLEWSGADVSRGRGPLPPGVTARVGGLVLERFLGAGGQGLVYSILGGRMAMKIARHGKEHACDATEFELLSRARHAHVVEAFSQQEVDGVRFIKMHSVACTLEEAWLTPDELEVLRLQVRSALDHVHSARVAHGSPSARNIGIDRDSDGRPHARLLDFGHATDMTNLDGHLHRAIHVRTDIEICERNFELEAERRAAW